MENMKFLEDLKRAREFEFRWERSVRADGELDISAGVHLAEVPCLPRLDSAFKSLRRFLAAAPVPDNGPVPLAFRQADTGVFESYQIVVNADGVLIAAGDAEGFRRAVYHLEDLLLSADGPFLKYVAIHREPWIRSRISRCFFGPTKRPPYNRDELADEIDYYPEPYLEKLAAEGINGLWLTVEWRDIASTSFTETAPGAAGRLLKLRQTVRRCLEYGIKTYIFCIEPAASRPGAAVLAAHPEFTGADAYGNITFCVGTENGRRYLREATASIFKAVPELGGMITISYGERPTSCLSSLLPESDDGVACRDRCGMANWEIYHALASAMRDGMHEHAPSAELITWFYIPQAKKLAEWVTDVASHVPDKVIFQFNFESNIRARQLGRERTGGGDYWLSRVGPSGDFFRVAVAARENHTAVSAKLQVASSHEVATVPMIPVPGILYRKYRKMRELGVTHVMQCWYFGNYPGLMNKAVGMLAFTGFEQSEKDFLQTLALPEWGAAAARVVRAWRHFARAYHEYPLSNMFQYYGPVHTGVVWPWRLQLTRTPLAPTWRCDFPTGGDAVGECLREHSLQEAATLTGRMTEEWRKGLALLKQAAAMLPPHDGREQDVHLAEALGIQFASAWRVLKFYAWRRDFSAERVPEIKELIADEIRDRKQMLELCRLDSRLGYHSEAEAYLYDARKIQDAIAELEALSPDIPAPLPECPVYRINSGWRNNRTFRWRLDTAGERLLRLTVEAPLSEDREIFEIAFSDPFISEPVKFLTFGRRHVIRDMLECSRAAWLDREHFEAVFPVPYPELAGSVSCAVGPHDHENMIDGWPRFFAVRPPLRLELRYFRPDATGLFLF